MKARYTKILLLTIASVGLSAGLLYAAKPSLRAARAAKTVEQLLAVIRTASGGKMGDFFVYNEEQKRFTAPDAARITLNPRTLVGQLKSDFARIELIKGALKQTPAFKRKNARERQSILAWVDQYKKYLLYFEYKHTDGKTYLMYINNPWPQMTPTAIYNIIQKWDTHHE